TPISWHLLNPDDGRPLLYDLEYSNDHFENYLTVQAGINDTLFYWNNPPLENGDTCWFRVKGYSTDTTLVNYSESSKAFVYMAENTAIHDPELNNPESSPFRLYPNPANEVLNIEFSLEPHSFQYQIYDLVGKKLSESSRHITGKRSMLSIKNLTPGTYIIRFSIDAEEFSATFRVQQ
ncbi:MAG: T9SS type A sorting domain-containing protein, partial [Bacteroidales bacterium]|nr:T9SS type A sorting domain-containing protein [Bacteroidales bacterium]